MQVDAPETPQKLNAQIVGKCKTEQFRQCGYGHSLAPCTQSWHCLGRYTLAIGSNAPGS